MVDRNGVPLAMRVTGANESDQHQLSHYFPSAEGRPGRPLKTPYEAYADASYDSGKNRMLLRWLGVEPKIRKRGTALGGQLGKVRWAVERSLIWIKGLRRKRVRYDRSETIIETWSLPSMAVVRFRPLIDIQT